MDILRELRKRSGLTIREVEAATSISNAYISQLETGKIKHPSTQALFILSKLYGVDMMWLLKETGVIKEPNIKEVPMTESLEDRLKNLEKKVDILMQHHNMSTKFM